MMAFQSILFEQSREYNDVRSVEMPAFFIDLNLDQIIDAVIAEKKEYNLRPFFHIILRDVESVMFRQEIARDLERGDLLEKINAFADRMVIMRRYLGLVDRLDYPYHRKGWFLEAVLVYCAALKGLAQDLSQADLHSRGLLSFRDYLTSYVESAAFQALVEESSQCKAALSGVRYSVIIKGNWVRVRGYESEIDYSVEVENTFKKFQQGAVKDYRVKSDSRSGFSHVEAQILDLVAKIHPEIFDALDQFCSRHSNFEDEMVRVFDRQIQFYVAYLEYIARMKRTGLKFCYPEVSSSEKDVSVENGFDLALANKHVPNNIPVVCNDFALQGRERIIVVSGPNQGGKTTFARMFGQLHYLASLGCPVPGSRARLFLCDQLYTHFEKEEKIKNLRGKLQDDLVRIHDILAEATPQSIIIMNEIFTSTTLKDAVFLSKKVMDRIIELDLLCVCVTFIDELATLSEKTISMVSTVVPENPAERTFKIVRRPSDGLAFAISIAEKYHLTYDLLKERIQR